MLEINTQFNDEIANKLAYIQQKTEQEINEILAKAIDSYYQKIKGNKKTTLELLEESGLVGCINAESNLSTNYKSILRGELDSKYDNN